MARVKEEIKQTLIGIQLYMYTPVSSCLSV